MSVSVQPQDFDLTAEVRALTAGRTDIGAIVTFTGTVRGEAKGRPITSMTLEHYPGMTEAELAKVEAEAVELPTSVVTIADLVGWLVARGPEYAEAFANPKVVRAAIDRTHVKASAEIGAAREIAFFPPVTGG